MEYIAGYKLIDYLLTNELSVTEREKLCLQYISAMAYVHSKSDMHRDISYSNIMVDVSGTIKVLDFGFARGTDDSGYDTVYKDIVHKFAIDNEAYGIKTEVYCIGAILFSIATKGEFKRSELDRLNSCECNSTLISVIKKCLSENPEMRFADANEIQAALVKNEISETNDFGLTAFNLDDFRKNVFYGIQMYFEQGYLPNYDSVKYWLENDLKDIVESHIFLNEIKLFTLLKKLPYWRRFVRSRKSNEYVDKEIVESMYVFYNHLQDKMKSVFVKNVLIILLEHSYEEEEEELPFN